MPKLEFIGAFCPTPCRRECARNLEALMIAEHTAHTTVSTFAVPAISAAGHHHRLPVLVSAVEGGSRREAAEL